MFCSNCGFDAGNAKFCPECGHRLQAQAAGAVTDTAVLTIRKYRSERMRDIVADIYVDGVFQTVIDHKGSSTLTLTAGDHELLIHADGCVDAIQTVRVEPLEHKLCIFSVDDVGVINIVQQGDQSRSASYSEFRYTVPVTRVAETRSASAVAYQEPEMPVCFESGMPETRSNANAMGNVRESRAAATYAAPENTKYCKFCGSLIHEESVVCPNCGRQVEELRREAPKVTVHNAAGSQTIVNTAPTVMMGGKAKDKWIAFLLCLFFGVLGFHKFYEGRVGAGLLYLCTAGLFGIGVLIDLIAILMKPNPYYV